MGKSGTEKTEDRANDQKETNFNNESPSSSETASTKLGSMSYRRLGLSSLAFVLCCLVQKAFARLVALCSAVGLIILLTFWFYDGIGMLILLHIAVLGVLYNAQDLLLYYPDQPAQSFLFVESPSMFGLPFDNITVKTKDGVKINMFLIKQPPNLLGTAPTVIYFHGNAGNIGHRLPNAHGFYHRCKANILLVEYRGYGRSRGHPSESGLYLDAEAALDYVFSRSDINQQRLVVFGRSLGGAVAVRTCSVPYYSSRVACLVVENTFTSIPEMAHTLFDVRLLSYIPEWCYKNKFLSRYRIDKIEMPTLFVGGLKDNLVPPKMMLHLYNISGSRLKRLALFPNGTHNETWNCRGYYEVISHFFSEVDQFSRGKSLPPEGTYPVSGMYRDGEEEDL